MSIQEKETLLREIDEALNDVRPHLQVDGGNIEVLDITPNNVVKVKWLGTCEGCTMSTMTMRAGIEQTIKGKFPEIAGVEAVNGVGFDA